MIKFKDFMDLLCNWGGTTRICHEDWKVIVEGKTQDIMDNRNDLYDQEVATFDLHANILSVKIKNEDAKSKK